VLSIGAAAFANNELTEVNIPTRVTGIGDYAFTGNQLTELAIPDSVLSIGEETFSGCRDLSCVTIGSGITSIGANAFYNCGGLKEFIVSPENGFYSSADGVLFNKDKTTLLQFPAASVLESYNIPDGVTTIGNSAFENCYSLTGVTIPASVETIGNGAFNFCESLNGLVIPSGVTIIGDNAFFYCTGLTDLTIPESVESIGSQAFGLQGFDQFDHTRHE